MIEAYVGDIVASEKIPPASAHIWCLFLCSPENIRNLSIGYYACVAERGCNNYIATPSSNEYYDRIDYDWLDWGNIFAWVNRVGLPLVRLWEKVMREWMISVENKTNLSLFYGDIPSPVLNVTISCSRSITKWIISCVTRNFMAVK